MASVSRLHDVLLACRYLGPGWLVGRVAYAAAGPLRLLERRLPAHTWDDVPLADLVTDARLADPDRLADHRRSAAPPFFFGPETVEAYPARFPDSTAAALADEVLAGTLRYFSVTPVEIGFPPDWHRQPRTGDRLPTDRHWSRLGDFAFGDIKWVWEASRFSFAFALCRAYAATRDDRYAEGFWRAVDDWYDGNPPQRGANWKCGQEVSLRVMAWCFGLYVLASSPATTAARVALLVRMLGISGRRIEANIGYAIRQKNNHGVSEAVGLFTLGLLFPELRDADRWRRRGRRLLVRLADTLIYDDGSFVQHSVNYHRMMLQQYVWAVRLAEVGGEPLPERTLARLREASDFLYDLQDTATGKLPRYGANDGALVLPLSDTPHDDYRPVTQAAALALGQGRRHPAGPWDEESYWLVGSTELEQAPASRERPTRNWPVGGYACLRSEHGFAFARAARFRHRPSQADQLHADVWWRGHAVALDTGTFSYNEPPWDRDLAGTGCHNTVTVAGRDPMRRVGKFLWLPWVLGLQRGPVTQGELGYWEGQHDGYLRLGVRHRRAIVRLPGERWLVLDTLRHREGKPFLARLHWLLADVPFEWDVARRCGALAFPGCPPYGIALGCEVGGADVRSDVVRAEPTGTRGWQAPQYGQLAPAWSLAVTATAASVHFATVFGPGEPSLQSDLQAREIRWRLASGETVVLGPSAAPDAPLVARIETQNHRWEPRPARR